MILLPSYRTARKHPMLPAPPYNVLCCCWRGYTLVMLVLLFSITHTACHVSKHSLYKAYKSMSLTEKQLADSLLAKALDHEALYTLLDTLKPISSISFYQFPLFSSNPVEADSALHAIHQLQQVTNKLSKGNFEFILNPFQRTDSVYRNMEIYVVRKSRLQSMIQQHADFYSKWGITTTANAATILALTEYETKYDRWRSFGYLFGYPDYAVDFFVAAGKEQDSTRQFVKRDFLSIPVFAASSGYFTYAVPKGYQTGNADSILYKTSMTTLDKYKGIRNKFITNGNFNAFKLWIKQPDK